MQVFMQRVKRAAVVTQKYAIHEGVYPVEVKSSSVCSLWPKWQISQGNLLPEKCQFPYGILGIRDWLLLSSWYWSETELSQYLLPQFLLVFLYTSFFLSLMFCLTYTKIQCTGTLNLLKLKYEVHYSQHNYWYLVNKVNLFVILVMYQALVQLIPKLSVSCNTPV